MISFSRISKQYGRQVMFVGEETPDDGAIAGSGRLGDLLRGLSTHVLELGEGSGGVPHLYSGSYAEYVERTGHEAPGVRA